MRCRQQGEQQMQLASWWSVTGDAIHIDAKAAQHLVHSMKKVRRDLGGLQLLGGHQVCVSARQSSGGGCDLWRQGV